MDGSLNKFIDNKICNFSEQEWGFPKGRKNKFESNSETAIREFTEETGIPATSIKLVNKKFIEHYISYDDVEYKNVYFLAKYTGESKIFEVSSKQEQISEVSAIRFFSIVDATSTHPIDPTIENTVIENYVNKLYISTIGIVICFMKKF